MTGTLCLPHRSILWHEESNNSGQKHDTPFHPTVWEFNKSRHNLFHTYFNP